MAFKDLSGEKFGLLVVVSLAGFHKSKTYWRCRCECGKEVVRRADGLAKRINPNCGCRPGGYRHGYCPKKKYKSEWGTWAGMIARCRDPKAHAFADYGGRGITVCERWLVFENFLEDMGNRPEGRTLDRKNNNGNYEPGNCRWATRIEQQQNRRTNSVFTAFGETKCLSEWARYLGLPKSTLANRIRRGRSMDQAIAMGGGHR